jgi:hypothetical protein
MRLKVGLTLTIIVLLCTFAASAETTQPGLFFTISNGCSAAVSGFAVGDEVCLMQINSAVFTRAIFQGTMARGEQKFAMACAGKDGNGTVIFVPWAGAAMAAVVVTVKPDQVVNIPKTFCAPANAAPESQLRHKR